MRPLRVLTWHIHGNYLLYLSRANVEFLLPVKDGRHEGYGGRGATFPFPDRVRDVPAEAVRDAEFDLVLYQTRRNYEVDGPRSSRTGSGGFLGSTSNTTRRSSTPSTSGTGSTSRGRCWST